MDINKKPLYNVENGRRYFDMTAMKLSEAFWYMYPYEVTALQTLASSIPGENPVFINFGAGTGTSGLALRAGNLDAQVYTIDINGGDSPFGGLGNERNAFANSDYDLPIQIEGCSWEVGASWKIPSDIVFVDGDHSAQAVEKDIDAWMPNVKPGGYMVFHDYGRDVWPDVKKVVDKKMKKTIHIYTVETLIIFRIP